jgi:hypothetical protein
MKKEENLTYLVKLLKKDGTNVDLVETEDFNEAMSIWKLGHEQWTSAVAERKPFLIEEPSDNGYITAFDPSLIIEICILPKVQQQTEANPYKRRMNSQGFSATFPGGGQLLDGGMI